MSNVTITGEGEAREAKITVTVLVEKVREIAHAKGLAIDAEQVAKMFLDQYPGLEAALTAVTLDWIERFVEAYVKADF